jgi:hypothetical protein
MEWRLVILILVFMERMVGALDECRELGFEEPSEVGFEEAGLSGALEG